MYISSNFFSFLLFLFLIYFLNSIYSSRLICKRGFFFDAQFSFVAVSLLYLTLNAKKFALSSRLKYMEEKKVGKKAHYLNGNK